MHTGKKIKRNKEKSMSSPTKKKGAKDGNKTALYKSLSKNGQKHYIAPTSSFSPVSWVLSTRSINPTAPDERFGQEKKGKERDLPGTKKREVFDINTVQDQR